MMSKAHIDPNLYSTEKVQELLYYSEFGLGDMSNIQFDNPLLRKTVWQQENPHLHIFDIFRNLDYLPFLCKHIFNVELLPIQHTILREMFIRPFPMLVGSRGFSKSFLMALYAMLRLFLNPGCKVVVAGAAFRQSKLIFQYVETIFDNAPLLKSLLSKMPRQGMFRAVDSWTMRIGKSEATAIPIGTGDKIRGLRANYLLCDEFRSINETIYEEVLAGFAAVSQDPIGNVKQAHRNRKLRELGLWIEPHQANDKGLAGNQAIISGTASYDFEPFARYWHRYHDIIMSQGKEQKLREIFGEKPIEGFDWRDYSIMRLPIELIPEGFMDAKNIGKAKATNNAAVFQLEYGAVFVKDSEGFFKRSLIETCTAFENNEHGLSPFSALIYGKPGKEYVYGIDPASEDDNFSIVIVELGTPNKIVYCWTTKRSKFRDQQEGKTNVEIAFYGFINRKIRDLMKVFPTKHIGIDKQGGGVAVVEILHDKDKLEQGDALLWPYVKWDDEDPLWWEDKNKLTDGEAGSHILHLIQFAKAEWVSQANHGTRLDFEAKNLIFPHFDSLLIELEVQKAKIAEEKGIETSDHIHIEDCILEIEELKDELSTIVMTKTLAGREKWDTPETKVSGNKKGKLRKDRYSALIIANMIARSLVSHLTPVDYGVIGGFADELKDKKSVGPMATGPEWWTSQVNNPNIYDNSLVRRDGV